MLFLIGLWLLLLFPDASIQQSVSNFVNPPPASGTYDYGNNKVFLIGSSQRLNWITNLEQYSVWIWQQDLTQGAATLGSPIFTKDTDAAETGGFTWIVTNQLFDITRSNVFFLALAQNTTLNTGLVSHYFNLTTDPALAEPATGATTSASSSSTTAASSSSSSSSSSSPSRTQLPSPTSTTFPTATTTSIRTSSIPSQEANDTMGSAAKMGLGVGLGVGIPLISILTAILVLMLRKNRRHDNQLQGHSQAQQTAPPVYEQEPYRHESTLKAMQQLPAELSGYQR